MTPQLLVIAHTTYVTPRFHNEAPFYEITAAPDLATDAPTTVLLTRDEDLYQRALAVEGTEQRVALTWRQAKRPNQRACLVLESLQLEPATALF